MLTTLAAAVAIAFIAGSNMGSGNHANFTQSTQALAANAEPVDSDGSSMTTVYRCDAAGKRHYLSYPSAGCEEIYVVSPPTSATHTLVANSNRNTGYQWAESHHVTNPSDCSGDSQGFVVGCQAYAMQAIASTDTSGILSIR